MIYNRAGIIKKTDKIASDLTRAKGRCERCGKTNNLQCAHIISRSYMATRFDPDNLICLCAGCHIFWWHKEPIEASRWLEENWPGRYDKLNFKRQGIKKTDVQGWYLFWKEKT